MHTCSISHSQPAMSSSNADAAGGGAYDGDQSARKRQKLPPNPRECDSGTGDASAPGLSSGKTHEPPQRDVSCDSTDGLKCGVDVMDIDSSTDERTGTSASNFMKYTSSQKKLIGLRLEANFHPKFDNENRTTADIRNRMLERVAQSQGYLEVSLKHSGSLLLWSGGMRYYSKNSTDNRYAHAGEVILRQHFARAWTTADDAVVVAESKYKECSNVVEARRLTLSFEVVTSILGQHGDIPNRDFLILTAVADKSSGGRGRFFDTPELVEFAQRFRLPHNDFWVYQTTESCSKLFDLYDKSRETALADGTIAALSATCDGGNHIESIYPHVAFQGNILEGLVIRYVPYANQGSDIEQRVKHLALASSEILKAVPPMISSSFEQSLNLRAPKVLRTDIRALCPDCSSPSSIDSALANVLAETNGGSERRKISFIQGRDKKTLLNPLQCAHELLQGLCSSSTLDSESSAIASLIVKLDELHIPVDYKIFEERVGDLTRTLVTVHIMNDYSFQKYFRHMKSGDMPLYRGFVVELLFDGESTQSLQSEDDSIADSLVAPIDVKEPLMLKMKCLSYMVRTFGVRNGLSILEKSGSEAYDRYTMNLLKNWGVSHAAMEQWQPFFHAWGLYARDILGNGQAKSSSSNAIPALSTDTYLNHLGHFSNLFYAGELKGNDDSSLGETGLLRGLIIVVGLTREASAEATKSLAECLHSHVVNDVNSFTENDMLNAMMQGTGGVVCSAVIEDGTKTARALTKKYRTSLRIIFFDCSDEEVEKSLEPGNDLKKRIGMLKGWRKVPCKSMLEWPDPSSLKTDIDALSDQIYQESASASSEETESGPGLLVFFPSIPGCGKSSICNGVSADMLNLKSLNKTRTIKICVGDKVEGKYWPFVRRERLLKPSSICIADKNAPPKIWSTVCDIAAASRGVSLPVLPDQLALCTTSVEIAPGKRLNFPFSLPFLATCMLRVISRPEDSHCGKLDASCEDACMVVAKFYCLYRNMSAEQLLDRCRSSIETSGAHLPSDMIRVPFFCPDVTPKLPDDLVDIIQDAISLQSNIESSKARGDDTRVLDVESRLRKALMLHQQLLDGLTAKEEESKASFVAQLSKHVSSLENLELDVPRMVAMNGSFIKIVSIDVDTTSLMKLLQEMSSKDEDLARHLKAIGVVESNSDDKIAGGTLVKEPHATMAHYSQLSQIEMRSRFGNVVDKEVRLKVSACLYGDTNVALSVSLPKSIEGEIPVALPTSENKYPHITVWFAEGSEAADSNKLPGMVAAGTAQAFQPIEEIAIAGRLSYWLIDKPVPL